MNTSMVFQIPVNTRSNTHIIIATHYYFLAFLVQFKEVKFRPGTDEGDYKIKLRNLKRFLEAGDKAKVTMRFRGREHAHRELGLKVLQRVEKDLQEISVVESKPQMEGRQMVMVIAPKKK